MDEEKRKKLIERRKKQQQEKEIRNDIAQHLHQENKKIDLRAVNGADENRYLKAAILFFGTIIPLYAFIFIPYWIFNFLWGSHLSKVGLPIGEFIPYLHGAILLVSLISVFRGKSLLDSFFDYFSSN